MEKYGKDEKTDVYERPVIMDYGTLQELTASGGNGQGGNGNGQGQGGLPWPLGSTP
jgi:hypothetical protein